MFKIKKEKKKNNIMVQAEATDQTIESVFVNKETQKEKTNLLSRKNNVIKILQYAKDTSKDETVKNNIIKYIRELCTNFVTFSNTNNDTQNNDIRDYYNGKTNKHSLGKQKKILYDITNLDIKGDYIGDGKILSFIKLDEMAKIKTEISKLVSTQTNYRYNEKELFETGIQLKKTEYYLTNGINPEYNISGRGTQGAIQKFIEKNASANKNKYYNPNPQYLDVIYNSGATMPQNNIIITADKTAKIKGVEYSVGSVFLQKFEENFCKMGDGTKIPNQNIIKGVFDIFGVDFRKKKLKKLIEDKNKYDAYISLIENTYSKLFENYLDNNKIKIYDEKRTPRHINSVLVVNEIPGETFMAGATNKRVLTKIGIQKAYKKYKNKFDYKKRVIFGRDLHDVLNDEDIIANITENKENKEEIVEKESANEQKARIETEQKARIEADQKARIEADQNQKTIKLNEEIQIIGNQTTKNINSQRKAEERIRIDLNAKKTNVQKKETEDATLLKEKIIEQKENTKFLDIYENSATGGTKIENVKSEILTDPKLKK